MDYIIDTKASIIKWVGYQLKVQHTGNVQFSQGKIRVVNKNIVGGYAQVDLTSIVVSSPNLNHEEQEKLASHLMSEDFFWVEEWPRSIIEIDELSISDESSTHTVHGEIMIKGVKQKYDIPVNVRFFGNTLEVKSKFNIDRTTFGINHMVEEAFGDKRVLPYFEIELLLIAIDQNQ